MIILTNNDTVVNSIKEKGIASIYIEGSNMDVLTNARGKIHMGYKLLTHPLSGSVKPNEKRFLSIAISKRCYKDVDLDSLRIIEEAIDVYSKFVPDDRVLNDKVLNDLKLIDWTLIMSIF